MQILEIDRATLLQQITMTKIKLQTYEKKYRAAKEEHNWFYMKSHLTTIHKLQAEYETLNWVLKKGVIKNVEDK